MILYCLEASEFDSFCLGWNACCEQGKHFHPDSSTYTCQQEHTRWRRREEEDGQVQRLSRPLTRSSWGERRLKKEGRALTFAERDSLNKLVAADMEAAAAFRPDGLMAFSLAVGFVIQLCWIAFGTLLQPLWSYIHWDMGETCIFVCLSLTGESTFVEKKKQWTSLLPDVNNRKKFLNVVITQTSG